MRCQVDNCCFCVPLGDSIFILGYLKLFLGLTIFVIGSGLLSYSNTGGHPFFIFAALLSLSIMTQGMFVIGTSLLLIIGGHKRKSLPLRSYVWISIAGLVMEVIYMLVVVIDVRAYQIWILVLVTASALEIYFMIVIRSVYMEIDKSQATIRHGHDIENPLTT